jgi:hypothetical protein
MIIVPAWLTGLISKKTGQKIRMKTLTKEPLASAERDARDS